MEYSLTDETEEMELGDLLDNGDIAVSAHLAINPSNDIVVTC